MCGRYVAKWSQDQFEKTFNLQTPLFESYNVAPTHYAPVIRQPGAFEPRALLNARWGLIPKWVDKPADFRANLFNARAETLREKASFKRPFRSQRCLVPASGFFEWKKLGETKQPYYVHAEDRLLAFAGLYDHWQKAEDDIYSYSVITTSPNALMSGLHDRMPVILDEQDFDTWLDPESELSVLESLLRPFDGELRAHPVDRRVGRVRENDKGLIEPLD